MKHEIGIIAGNFDVIHPGYIHMFDECKMYCDKLIILLQTDPSLERPEKLKPILSVDERKLVLMALEQVDGIFTYTREKELYKLIKDLNPDIRFLGDDYIGKSFTGDDLNIPLHFLDRSHGWSTTKFKTLIASTVFKDTPLNENIR
jgi:glycerol-3-phosphate cytidylyltransferase